MEWTQKKENFRSQDSAKEEKVCFAQLIIPQKTCEGEFWAHKMGLSSSKGTFLE